MVRTPHCLRVAEHWSCGMEEPCHGRPLFGPIRACLKPRDYGGNQGSAVVAWLIHNAPGKLS